MKGRHTVKKRRVFVFSSHSLLISGVLSLLREHPEIDLITGGDEGELSRRIREAAPEVVVVDAGQAGEDMGLTITRFLRDHPGSTLIALSLDQPGIAVLRSQRLKAATWEGLLGILDGTQRNARRVSASRSERQETRP